MQNALRANAAKRLRQKEKLVTVPIVEPPSGVDLTMLSTIQPHTRPPPPGSRNTSAAGAVTGVAPAEGECPADSKPPSVAAAMADEHGSSVTPRPLRDEAHSPNALSISHSPISKLHVELFPEAVAKYRQILCVASDMQQTKRLERCLNDDTAKTEVGASRGQGVCGPQNLTPRIRPGQLAGQIQRSDPPRIPGRGTLGEGSKFLAQQNCAKFYRCF